MVPAPPFMTMLLPTYFNFLLKKYTWVAEALIFKQGKRQEESSVSTSAQWAIVLTQKTENIYQESH